MACFEVNISSFCANIVLSHLKFTMGSFVINFDCCDIHTHTHIYMLTMSASGCECACVRVQWHDGVCKVARARKFILAYTCVSVSYIMSVGVCTRVCAEILSAKLKTTAMPFVEV